MRAHYSVVSTSSALILAIFLTILAGCSALGIESKRVDYKSGAVKAPPLDVPPDLTALIAGDRYVIPDSGGEIVANYSDYSKGEPARKQPAQPAVLPEVPNVYLERSGADRWLVAEDKAENVWAKVKAFWQESGFTILTDNPRAGLIETDWAENRAQIPQGGFRAIIGKVFDKVYSSGEKDSYRTRLERKKDGSGTEIHIRHRGMVEVFSADKTTSKWQPRPNDPEMEAAMLQMLMVRLGGAATIQSAIQTESEMLGEVAPQIETLTNGSKNMLLNEPFDKCWRRVGLALERAAMVVSDKDRAKGIYFVNISKKTEPKQKSLIERLKFWRSDEAADKPETYQVLVFEVNAVCRVSAVNKGEAKDETTTQIVESLYQQLKK